MECATIGVSDSFSKVCSPHLTVCGFFKGGEHPSAGSSDFKISVLDPRCSFARVSSHRPAPEHYPDLAIHLIEDFLGDHVVVIVRSSPQNRAEQPDQIDLFDRLVGLDHFPELGKVSPDVRFR